MPDGQRPKRVRLSAADRRAAIIEAAREVFLAEGYVGARTRLIAERAGINEAVLYQHFESKEELFEASVLEALLEDVVEMGTAVERVLDASTDLAPDELLAAVERQVFTSTRSMLPLLGVALFSGQKVGEPFYRDRLVPALEEGLAGVRKRLAGESGTIGPRLLPIMMAASLGPAIDADFRGVRPAQGRISKQAADLLAHGLSSSPTT